MTDTPNQFITFKLGNELFAINVEQVREVLEMSTITRVPTSPDYMRVVVNVRGKAIRWSTFGYVLAYRPRLTRSLHVSSS